MSQHEQFAWGSLLASVATWLFLTMRMTESWMIVNASPRHISRVFSSSKNSAPEMRL